MSSLRLVTLNTWKCGGDYERRLLAIAEELLELNPGIVALQESFYTADGKWNTARFLAERLDMHWHTVACRRKQRVVAGIAADSFSGLSVLTKFRVKASCKLSLTAIPEDNDRCAQLIEISVAGLEFLLVNLHLTHIRRREDIRIKQLTEVVAYCKRFKKNAVLCGDFNTTIPSLIHHGAIVPEGELQDTWRLAGGTEPRPATLHGINLSRQGLDDNGESEGRCIDHILVLPQNQEGLSFSNPRRVFERVNRSFGILPSDHMGLAVTISGKSV